jgi:hypothetical protein
VFTRTRRPCVSVWTETSFLYAQMMVGYCVFHTVGYPLAIVNRSWSTQTVLSANCYWLDGSVEVASGVGITIERAGSDESRLVVGGGRCSRQQVSAAMCNFVSYCPAPTVPTVSLFAEETCTETGSESVSETGGESLAGPSVWECAQPRQCPSIAECPSGAGAPMFSNCPSIATACSCNCPLVTACRDLDQRTMTPAPSDGGELRLPRCPAGHPGLVRPRPARPRIARPDMGWRGLA